MGRHWDVFGTAPTSKIINKISPWDDGTAPALQVGGGGFTLSDAPSQAEMKPILTGF
jgi:hypothetical protein